MHGTHLFSLLKKYVPLVQVKLHPAFVQLNGPPTGLLVQAVHDGLLISSVHSAAYWPGGQVAGRVHCRQRFLLRLKYRPAAQSKSQPCFQMIVLVSSGLFGQSAHPGLLSVLVHGFAVWPGGHWGSVHCRHLFEEAL